MRQRTKILGLSVLVVLVLTLLWLSTPSKVKVDSIVLIISTNAPQGYNSFFTAFLTNKTVLPIGLESLGVELETEDGKVVLNLAESWTGTDGKQTTSLPPKGLVSASPQADPTHKRVRLVAQYSWDAGRLAGVLSPVIRKIPQKLISNGQKQWLARHGLVDGKLRAQVASDWMINPSFRPTLDSRRDNTNREF